MPEMPEVEQVRKTLAPHIEGKTITGVKIMLDRLIKHPTPEKFIEGLVGKTISHVGRKGKYLVLETAPNQQLIVHLRMTGALIAQSSEQPEPAYAKIRFDLTDGVTMWFTDIRTFGTLYLVTDHDAYIEGYETLGPEPLSAGLTLAYLAPLVAKSRKPIKTFILDQHIIAGLGNIYADESLALSGILPTRQANTLTETELVALIDAINAVIAQGIKNRGTTFRDYKDGEGNKGDNQNHLLVYGRGDEPCKKCGAKLCTTKVGGRGTVYCEHCQK
ncbi:bifunctional DNA-formamidopyrimidine glycosylase/DNA-(apurinic or apyrimidinic site) lyase [Phascolarctobacterium sp.]|uniref:bifunctional DNA-formamidopyrimidine glycosylase/DNA-(apurinic or apyrimidinic site) lyase n=1 Tax=Phascolarctobacterium sp. TaxID=2049039 RepID=UPI003868D9D8